MRFTQCLTYMVLAASTIDAASLRHTERDALSLLEETHDTRAAEILSPENALEKRKGGGGKGGGGGSGGGGGKSGGGSSGGSSGRTSSSSFTGGSTKSGSGPTRGYGGGGYYGGGAAVPYSAGKATPRGLPAGALILPVAALAIFPGLWLWSVYPYHLNDYRFYNQSARNNTRNEKRDGMNETLPVTCLCQQYSVCGCESNDNTQYLNDLVGNGSYQALNKTLVTVADVNGTKNLVINGTLPNGTTAPGGTDDAAAGLRIPGYAGYLVVAVIAFVTVM